MQGLALQTRDLLRSLRAPALAPFLADWPDPVRSRPITHGPAAGTAIPSAVLPVLGWMTDIAYDEEIIGVSVIADLCRHAQSLTWRQTYTARDIGEEFMRNYGYSEILGPTAPLTAARIACGLLLLGPSTSSSADDVEAKAALEALEVPSEQVLAIAARGVGVQIYECTSAKDHPTHFSWTLKAPEAVLQLKSGGNLGKHYAGPTWEATDGSKVVGDVVVKLDAPNGTAIPWLLLRAKFTSGAGIFSAIKSIQRLRTVGGKAPAAGCDQSQSGKEARVPYSAEYRFFTARP